LKEEEGVTIAGEKITISQAREEGGRKKESYPLIRVCMAEDHNFKLKGDHLQTRLQRGTLWKKTTDDGYILYSVTPRPLRDHLS